MPAARYWRLTRIESYNYGDLVLSEVALYEGVSRVDGSATISTVVPQSSGALSALSDADFGTSVTWPAAALLLPGFAIVWDFGSARDIVKVGLAGPSLLTFSYKFALEHSSDGSSWTRYAATTPASKWPGAASFYELFLDPTYDNVSLHLHFDSPYNLDRRIFDSSNRPKDITSIAGNDAATPDLVFVPKFGSTALRLQGIAGARLETPSNPDFDLGDTYTVEMWVNYFSFSESGLAQRGIFDVNGSTWTGLIFAIRYINSAVQFRFYFYGTSAANEQFINVSNSGQQFVQQNNWHHIAMVRDGTVGRVYIDGVLRGSITGLLSNGLSTQPLRIGNYVTANGNSAMNGYIDELRITKGVARYNANFTPAAAAFPDTYGDFDQTPLRGLTPVPAIISEYTPPPFGVSQFSAQPNAFDVEDGGRFQIVGTVKEVALPVNTPLARRVALYEERSGRLIRSTFSDNAGNYSFTDIRGDRPYTVIAFDHTETYRAVVADRINAVPMP